MKFGWVIQVKNTLNHSMKVLIINNVASMQAITAEALNKIENVEAKCVTIGSHKYISTYPSTIELKHIDKKVNIILYLYYKLINIYQVCKLIKWSTVVHYVWSPILPFSLDLFFCKIFKKIIFVEFVGSEIRKPSTLFKINSYYKNAFYNGYEYINLENSNEKDTTQNKFAKYKAKPTVCPEISLFLNRSKFTQIFEFMQRINVIDFKPQFPNTENNIPLIIHSPSAKIGKGSNIILPIIEEIKKEGYKFEFKLLHNISRNEVLKTMQHADIFIDQIICGGYGLATCEAMAFGKPVMCYIMPEVFEAGLDKNCPIVNTNPDNLKENLIKLITNPALRHNIGIESRKFVDKYHNADTIAKELVEIYITELTK
jgi:glycosyltransferase involved in cell wall biosynthesis